MYDSDSDSEPAHGVSYADERKLEVLQGRLHALDLGMQTSEFDGPAAADPTSTPRTLGRRLSVFRGDADAPPPPPAANTTPTKGITIDVDDKEDKVATVELQHMYNQVADCLEMRHRFHAVSLQNEVQNPKNQPGWKIYPQPPEPEYNPETKKFNVKPKRIHTPETVGVKFNFDDIEVPGPCDFEIELDDYQVFQVKDGNGKLLVDVPTLRDYYVAADRIAQVSSDGPTKTFAFRRLQYLDAKWNMYFLLNQDLELSQSKRVPHRDFYNVRKVDTHVHHSACMTQKHLLRFIKSKMKKSPNEVVIFRDGRLLTLDQVFESLHLTAYDLNIDTLDMHAHSDAFHRFDKFNLKYNPVGESRLREIFLKTDNMIQGRYLAEITREVFSDLEASKYQMAEYRISIYGRSKDEWSKLAAWVIDNKLISDNVRWLIQVPRLYDVYRKSNLVSSFAEVVANIWEPLFDVTYNPQCDPKLYVFLQRVVGFDSVDDESKIDRRLPPKYPAPAEWTSTTNPPYSYYLYYLWANMASLNHFRRHRGFNTFVLRPHSGEAGDPEHLISAFLTSQAISHGILLRKLPFIQFLYYLDQVGIAMSPISNNALFLSYEKNPLVPYFRRGLNVSLSTDDPLQFSFTREPLIEEYSIAIQIYKLTAVDSREIALSSVMQSGFEHEIKHHWGYNMHTGKINIEKTNVPVTRLAYRIDTLRHERELVAQYGRPVQYRDIHY